MLQLVGFLIIALCAAAQADVEVRDVIPNIGEYYFNGIPANWSTAYRQCQASGGYLAVINSDAEMEALQNMMIKHGADSILVGFHDQFVEGHYTFINGRNVSDSLWAPGAPSGWSTLDCGFLNSDGVYDDDCSSLSPFICELSEDQGGEEPTSDGFVLLEKFGYYKFHNKQVSWPEAWAVCRDEDSNLLVLETTEEHDALLQAYDDFLFSWVGLYRLWGPDDAVVTVDNIPVSQLGYKEFYTDLGSYETSPYVAIYSIGGLVTQGIYITRPFFCERPLATSETCTSET